jgi:FtsZ-binding cell division protein ZapB
MRLEEKIKTAEDRIKELQLLINEWKKAINDKRSQ